MKPVKPLTLAQKMRNRAPNPEAWKKAFGGTKAIEDGFKVCEHAQLVHVTDAALLVNTGTEEIWIPKSVLHEESEVTEYSKSGRLIVKAWFAKERGWDQ